jgi:hypothetical protein
MPYSVVNEHGDVSGVPSSVDYEAIAAELQEAHGRLLAIEQPLLWNSGPVRRLSSVIRSAAALLTIPINYASPGRVRALLDLNHDAAYQELQIILISIYRSTLTGAHTHLEESIYEWCNTHGVAIHSSLHDRWFSVRQKIEGELSPHGLKLFDRLEPPETPSASDVVKAADSVLNKDRRKVWLDYLETIVTIRNKLSHSRSATSPSQQERLRKAGFGTIIQPDGILRFNANFLVDVLRDLVEFFNEIERAVTS